MQTEERDTCSVGEKIEVRVFGFRERVGQTVVTHEWDRLTQGGVFWLIWRQDWKRDPRITSFPESIVDNAILRWICFARLGLAVPEGPPPRPAPFARSCCSMGSCLQQDTDLACNFLENRCLETLYPQWRGKVIWGSLAGEPGWGCFLSVAVINCSTKSNLEKDMSGWYF